MRTLPEYGLRYAVLLTLAAARGTRATLLESALLP
jgi:hypothetical protein